MSRSYKKQPYCGYTTAVSDKIGKKMINRRFRFIERNNIRNCISEDNYDNFNTTDINQISKWCYLAKDGKQYIKDYKVGSFHKDLKK